MEEIEIDEPGLDSPTLLDYLAHGLVGYTIGMFIYCIYLIFVLEQIIELPRGLAIVWGYRSSNIFIWGLLAPAIGTILGLLQVWIAPNLYIRLKEWLLILMLGALFISLVAHMLIDR